MLVRKPKSFHDSFRAGGAPGRGTIFGRQLTAKRQKSHFRWYMDSQSVNLMQMGCYEQRGNIPPLVTHKQWPDQSLLEKASDLGASISRRVACISMGRPCSSYSAGTERKRLPGTCQSHLVPDMLGDLEYHLHNSSLWWKQTHSNLKLILGFHS